MKRILLLLLVMGIIACDSPTNPVKLIVETVETNETTPPDNNETPPPEITPPETTPPDNNETNEETEDDETEIVILPIKDRTSFTLDFDTRNLRIFFIDGNFKITKRYASLESEIFWYGTYIISDTKITLDYSNNTKGIYQYEQLGETLTLLGSSGDPIFIIFPEVCTIENYF